MEAWPSRATLRRYGEVTRKYGKLLNELESVLCKGKNLLADINRLERLAMNMRALKGEEMTGTDAECCAYLWTAALTQPMDHDWGQIYLYIATQTYRRWGKNEMPGDIAVDSLRDDQERELNRLKEWLYKKRTQVRLERERTERRQKKEEEAARRKAEQPALFHF